MNRTIKAIFGMFFIGLLFLASCGKDRTYWPEREYRKHKPEPIARYDTRDLTKNMKI